MFEGEFFSWRVERSDVVEDEDSGLATGDWLTAPGPGEGTRGKGCDAGARGDGTDKENGGFGGSYPGICFGTSSCAQKMQHRIIDRDKYMCL